MGDVRDRGDVIVVHRGGHTVARIVPGASGALTVGELAALLEEPLEGEKADGTRKQR